jgi:hypothetical protein
MIDGYIQVEVKTKTEFEPPPFRGQGMDIFRIPKYLDSDKRCNLPCYFMVVNLTDNNIYGQWLEKLESGIHQDTKFKIRIWPMDSFVNLGSWIEFGEQLIKDGDYYDNPPTDDIEEQGRWGEDIVRLYLKSRKKCKSIYSPDWIVKI